MPSTPSDPSRSPGSSAVQHFLRASSYVCALILSAMTIGIFVAVFSRYLFGNPLSELYQFVEYSLLAIPVLGAAWLASEGGHVRVELITDFITRRNAVRLDAMAAVLGVLAGGFVVLSSGKALVSDFQSGITTPGLVDFPRWPLMALICLGFTMFVAQQILELRDIVRGKHVLERGDDMSELV